MNRKVICYLGILCVLCPLFYILIIRMGGVNNGSIFVLLLMWLPASAAVVSKLIFDHSVKGIGFRIRGWKYIGIAYITPLIGCILVYGFAWISKIGTLEMLPIGTLIGFSTFGVLISMLSALGEEIGWRGFLLTELRKKFTYKQVCLVIGLIWFVYHMPLILFSNYNNGNKAVSLVCFFIMVMSFTVIANDLCICAESLWPAVMLHASHNLFVQSIFDQMTITKTYTQFVTSEFGIGLGIFYGAIACYILSKQRKMAL